MQYFDRRTRYGGFDKGLFYLVPQYTFAIEEVNTVGEGYVVPVGLCGPKLMENICDFFAHFVSTQLKEDRVFRNPRTVW